MLDLQIDVVPSTRRLRFSPYIKETSIAVPLSDRSGQHVSVHKSWPQAELSRFKRLSSSRKIYNYAAEAFLHKYV